MTVQLLLSVFDQGANFRARIAQTLAEFEKQERIKVHLDVLSWDEGWTRLVNVALYSEGYDVSEVGSTWMGDFVKMDALTPFTNTDLRLIGQAEDFFPACWSSGVTKNPDGGSTVWSIPWAADSRIIFYRRDLLEKARIDETTAFNTFEDFDRTLTVLKQSGVEIPLALPLEYSRRQIHILAGFIWQAGGGFLDDNGKDVLFHLPAARAGMKTYFSLGKHLVPQVQQINENTSDQFFTEGHAAVTISGIWLLSHPMSEALRPQIGTAVLPVIPWVGGVNFVVWKHSLFKNEAMRLVKFLTNSPHGEVVYPILGLPARLQQMGMASMDANRQVLYQSVLSGRAFSNQLLWGLIEKRLSDLLPRIWEKILADPEADLDAILDQYITGLANRLKMTLDAHA